MVFLWNIFINNNWLNLSYMALLKFPKTKANFAKWYFVLFLIFSQFLVLSIIIGTNTAFIFLTLPRFHH
jgi:hypothetical protein